MTSLEISIMLHYATRADDFRDGDFRAPAVREAIDRFHNVDGLLMTNEGRQHANEPHYRITPRGLAYVDALERMPLPQQVWVMPPFDINPMPAGRTSKKMP